MKQLIYFIVFALVISCNKDDVELSGKIIDREEISVEDFTGINISGNINTKLVNGEYGVVITTDSNLFEYIQCTVRNNALNIYCDPGIQMPKSAAININISCPNSNLKNINIANGAKFVADTSMLGTVALSLSNKSLAFLTQMDISVASIYLNNSTLNISGKCRTSNVNVVNTGILNGGSFKTKESFVKVTGGSLAEVAASDSIYAEVSNFSTLMYKGVMPVYTQDKNSKIIKED